MALLGVNVDHIGTLRQARRTYEPDPVAAAARAELGGADGVTIHLREDRRHIQDRDLRVLRETVHCKLNLELASCDEVLAIACQVKPDQATIVPERRDEVTTEGGLDVAANRVRLCDDVRRLQAAGIVVSLFIDPDRRQVEAAREVGAEAIELHTGKYALARSEPDQHQELAVLAEAGRAAAECGLVLHAGHGLNYRNIGPVARVPRMCELNIGHAIVSRAVFVGMMAAVREMKQLIVEAKRH